jgi:alpha-N-arabinofuranosidase
VLALVRELAPTIMRYPGGNFVSGYNWETASARKDRPARLDLAWMSTEPNTFGTNEFVDWCRAAESSRCWRSISEPATAMRPQPGRILQPPERHGARSSPQARLRQAARHQFWCLGNEMDGPWQMEMKTATEYGRIATEAAKMMKWIDPRSS